MDDLVLPQSLQNSQKRTLSTLEKRSEIAKQNQKELNSLVHNSIKKGCYFESLILIHQAIEDISGDLFFIRKIFYSVADPRWHQPEKIEDRHAISSKEYSIANERYKYANFNEMNFMLGCYGLEIYTRIAKFNSIRNDAVHGYLKGKTTRYELKKQVKDGLKLRNQLEKTLHKEIMWITRIWLAPEMYSLMFAALELKPKRLERRFRSIRGIKDYDKILKSKKFRKELFEILHRVKHPHGKPRKS